MLPMSDFVISETDRPGIEKAAQWHEWQATFFRDEARKRMVSPSQRWGDYQVLMEWHRDCAASLRSELSPPISSAAETQWATATWAPDYLREEIADSIRSGAKTSNRHTDYLKRAWRAIRAFWNTSKNCP